MEKEANLYEQLTNNKVMCTACARRCIIPDGSHGFCYVRQNKAGKLYLENYGTLAAIQLDPIEKKPFFHFWPGTYVLGVGTSSCNFGCLFCQNHNISKDKEITGYDLSPMELVDLAIKQKADGIAYTYNEPAIFIEYALDTAKLAHEKGLYNVFVTNGYLTKEAIDKMKGNIDAAVVDFKGNGSEKFVNKYMAVPSIEPIKEALVYMKRAGIHIEITDLIVPEVGDSLEECDKLTKWIHDTLGAETPVQFTAFFPDYKMLYLYSTPNETLMKHYEVAKKNGLNYVYIGNVPGNKYENTYCPNCGAKVIGRYSFGITEYNIDDKGACKKCGYKIFIDGKRAKKIERRGITVFY
ncbi:MAG: AmmeMemoRadiSam system radical SAM enzyme [Candidatus Micrarchaeaceae archaeon]